MFARLAALAAWIKTTLSWGRAPAPSAGAFGLTEALLASPMAFGLIWVAVATLALLAAATAYGLEVWGKFPACRLCHLERLLLTLAGLAAGGVGFSGAAWVLMGAGLAWAGLAGVSLYHVGIQWGWWQMPHFCQISWAPTMDAFLSQPSARCDQKTLDIFGVPASLWLLLGALGVLAMAAFTLWIKPWRRA